MIFVYLFIYVWKRARYDEYTSCERYFSGQKVVEEHDRALLRQVNGTRTRIARISPDGKHLFVDGKIRSTRRWVEQWYLNFRALKMISDFYNWPANEHYIA